MNTKKRDVPEALLADYQKPEDLINENGLLKQLTKLLVEKTLDAEMAQHLGHAKHEPVANPAGNTRNGKSRKTLKGEFGELPIEVPRDRRPGIREQPARHAVKCWPDLGEIRSLRELQRAHRHGNRGWRAMMSSSAAHARSGSGDPRTTPEHSRCAPAA